ncbi:MAG: sodium:calcium antiporter [Candidatus Binatia bacterium]
MESWSLTFNAFSFLVAAVVIWRAGTRLEFLADKISRRTGLGQAFTGMLLLAAATSLPEVATTVTAVASLGNANLAVHNLLGGVAMQTTILVFADATMRRHGSLTFFSPTFALLVQGVGVVLLLQIAIAGITAKGLPEFHSVSLWVVLLVFAYVGTTYLVYRDRGQPRWTPSRRDDVPPEVREKQEEAEDDGAETRDDESPWLAFAGMSLVVLAGGWWATRTAEVLAEQTGLGEAFLGATLLATATSLPEVSTTFAAVRNDRYTVAISNIFGSNAFDVMLLALADILHREGTILASTAGTEVFIAAIGSILTCLFVWGLIERENRIVLRIGWDSVAAVLVYVGGMTVLFFLS